jgi:beta-lactamase class A
VAPTASAFSALAARIDEIAQELGGEGLAVSLYDYETGLQWSQRGDRWFHSASTIKVAVMLALFGAIDAGRFTLDSRLHVRNRFLSLVDGTPFRVAAGRDADKDVHASIGKTMRIGDLARHMIITSSNLATSPVHVGPVLLGRASGALSSQAHRDARAFGRQGADRRF